MNTETKFVSHISFSKLSRSSQVKNQTDQVFSIGNLTKTTFLNEFVFCRVFAAWFVILVNELKSGTFSINGSKKNFTLSQIRHWFSTNHNNRISPHNTRNQRKCITISGSHNLSIIASGNNSTILPIRLKTKDITRQRITKNNTVGNIIINHVKKLFLFLSFSSNIFSIHFRYKLVVIYYNVMINKNNKKSLTLNQEGDSFVISFVTPPAVPIEIMKEIAAETEMFVSFTSPGLTSKIR